MIYKFWMVYVEGKLPPAIQYFMKDEAILESSRLTRTTGKPSYVLEVVSKCSMPEPELVFETEFGIMPTVDQESHNG